VYAYFLRIAYRVLRRAYCVLGNPGVLGSTGHPSSILHTYVTAASGAVALCRRVNKAWASILLLKLLGPYSACHSSGDEYTCRMVSVYHGYLPQKYLKTLHTTPRTPLKPVKPRKSLQHTARCMLDPACGSQPHTWYA
jgi:hypothetical protein